jgi:antitoxin component of MazEF toxin-antitoxin module
MVRVLARTRKVGGSIIVSIPKQAIEQEGIREEGELIELEVRKARKDWFAATKEVGHFTKEDELDTHD